MFEWTEFYPALREFSEKYAFFDPMIKIIAHEKLSRTTWDKILFAGSASVGSLTDISTDLYTFFYYLSSGKTTEAYLMLGFMFTSLFIQLLVVVITHYGNKRDMLWECVYTVTFLKPAINEFRIMTNTPLRGHELIDSLQELIWYVGERAKRSERVVRTKTRSERRRRRASKAKRAGHENENEERTTGGKRRKIF